MNDFSIGSHGKHSCTFIRIHSTLSQASQLIAFLSACMYTNRIVASTEVVSFLTPLTISGTFSVKIEESIK